MIPYGLIVLGGGIAGCISVGRLYSVVVIDVGITGYVKRGSATNERVVVGRLFIIIGFNTCFFCASLPTTLHVR
uniref:Uncharacterized protein n=1 Tax=Arundo donax TaxID=35708 RepID=A0A0A9HUW0_ARUDO